MSHTRTILEEIRAKVRSPLAAMRQPFTADFFGLPAPDQLPTPGAARNWEYKNWKEWARPFGVTVESRSTHAYVITHPDFHTIFLSLPTSSGDFRAGRAGAQEIRQRFLGELERLAAAVALALDDTRAQVDDLEPADAVEAVRAYVKEHRYEGPFQSRILKMFAASALSAPEELVAASKRARNLLDKVTTRTGESPRVVLRRSLEAEESVESVLEILKNALPLPTDTAACLVQGLEDQLEALDIMEQEAREAKQRERDAKERDKAEKALVSATGAAGYQTAITVFRNSVAEHCRMLAKITEQASSQILAKMTTVERLSAEFQFPAYPLDQIRELLDRAKHAEQAAATANEKLAEALISRDEHAARVEALTPELERLRQDHNAALALFDGVEAGTNWREKYTELVTKLTPLLASDKILEVVSNLVSARELLKTARESIPPAPGAVELVVKSSAS